MVSGPSINSAWTEDCRARVPGCDVAVDQILEGVRKAWDDDVSSTLRSVRSWELRGPAGSGKSFVAKHIAETSGLQYEIIDAAMIDMDTSLAFPLTEGFLIVEQPNALSEGQVDELRRKLEEWNNKAARVFTIMTGTAPEVEVEVVTMPYYSVDRRRQILRRLVPSDLACPRDDVIDHIVNLTPGFLPCDLDQICRSAQLSAISRETQIRCDDFDVAVANSIPAQLRGEQSLVRTTNTLSVLTDQPGHSCFKPTATGFATVAGLAPAVEEIRHALGRFMDPTCISPVGLILEGKPGSGKTHLATAIASEIQGHFFSVLPATVLRSAMGDSEKNLADIFMKARSVAPAVVVLEDLQSWAVDQEDSTHRTMQRMVATLSQCLDMISQDNFKRHAEGSIESGVFVVATCLDASILHPRLLVKHRLSHVVALPSLTPEERLDVLKMYLHGRAKVTDDDLRNAAHGNAVELVHLCNEAAVRAVTRSINSGSEPCIIAEDLKTDRRPDGQLEEENLIETEQLEKSEA